VKTEFGIKLEYEENQVDNFVSSQNLKYVTLHNWQKEAIDYFWEHDGKVVYEVATGCLTGDTFIDMPRNLDIYPSGIKIKDLVGKTDFYVYSFNVVKEKLELKKALNVWLSKKDEDIYEIKTKSGKTIKATNNHKFLKNKLNSYHQVIERKWTQLKDLKQYDYITTFNRPTVKDFDNGELIKVDYKTNKKVIEHRFIMNEIYGLNNNEIVHHKDKNRFNNSLNNLKIMNSKKHNRFHTLENGRYGKDIWLNGEHPKGMLGKKHKEKTKRMIRQNTKKALNKISYIRYHSSNVKTNYILDINKRINNIKNGLKKLDKEKTKIRCSKNGQVKYSEEITSIKYIGKEDIYDMEVEDNHNFIANGIIAHNSGKTYCAIQILKQMLERHPKYYVLIVVPKNVILEKGWFPELYENGFTMAQVGLYYSLAKEIKQITITNIQNISNLDMKLFDFVIWDEIHNACTKRLLKFVEYPNKYKLGLSATIERMDNKHWQMLKAFNYNRFIYSSKQALQDDVLNKFAFKNIEVIMDEVTYDKYLKLTQDMGVTIKQGGSYYRIMQGKSGEEIKMRLLKIMNERKQLVLNYPLKMGALKLICKQHENEKTLVFNEFNKITTNAYFELLDVGIRAKVVHSGIAKIKIDKILSDYKKGKFNTLLATRILDEGYNLPSIEVGIIQAGNSTAKQTIQRLGRVLRKKEKPSILYQIYVANTMEEKQAMKRAKLFKDLSYEYFEYIYNEETDELVEK